jgi:hypothetical protein
MATDHAYYRIKLLWVLAAVAASFVVALVGAAQNQIPPPPAGGPAQAVHSILVKFDYDFQLTPACTSRITKNCIQRFVVYDISGGASESERNKLFTVPLPPNRSGMIRGISAISPPLALASGKHLLAVTALVSVTIPQNESSPQVCAIWVTVP